jgi:positive regulator of sigma E activity
MIRFFEKLVKLIAILQVASLPMAAFLVIAALCYGYFSDPLNLFIVFLVLVIGSIVSIWYALQIDKKYDAIDVIARVSASPDLDKPQKKKE